MAETNQTSFDVNSLLDDILQNPDKPADMSKDEIVDVQKKINLYGVVIPAETAYANFSIINWRDSYLRKLHTTALVGYLHRTCMEYVKTEHSEVVVPEELYNAVAKESANGRSFSELDFKAKDAINNEYRKAVKVQLEDFLRHNFDYNPDIHVRKCYKDNLGDPERVGKFAEMKEKMASPSVKPRSGKFEELREKLAKSLSSEDLSTLDELIEENQSLAANVFTQSRNASKVIKDVNRSLVEYKNGTMDNDDIRSILVNCENSLREVSNEMYPYVLNRVEGAYEWFPPADVFHHFDRYLSNHFELFREAVQILYNEKPDIEFAVQFYDQSFGSEEDAIKARQKIQDRVTASVITITNEGWYLLGPFKRNRERMDFYNKETEILKRMAEQQEDDSKLGADLMKKRVRRQKEKNIIEAGPDDPGLEKYKDALSVIESLGAKSVLTNEEKAKMAEAQRLKEMTEVPPDSIQVDIHRPVEDDDGNIKLVRDKFYTKAEAPKFMEDNLTKQRDIASAVSKGANPQAAMDHVMGANKTIKSKTGKITSLAELKNNIKPDGL